jgi:hypothetical protein
VHQQGSLINVAAQADLSWLATFSINVYPLHPHGWVNLISLRTQHPDS